MDYRTRLKILRGELRKRELDGIIISDENNRRYFSGFTGSAGTLFIDSRNAYIATDSRYYIQVGRQCPDFMLLKAANVSHYSLFMKKKKLEGKRIAYEADVITVAHLKLIRKHMKGVKLVATDRIPLYQRSIKQPEEIKKIRAIQKITDECFKMLLKKVKPGMREIDIAWMIEKFHRENGAQANSFDPIVASGPNSALPHAVPTIRKVKKGEPLLFDFGGRKDGYNSDMTRVIFFGKPSRKMDYVYNRVLEAHLMVFELTKPGAKVADIDRTTRDYIYKSEWNKKNLMGDGKGQGRYEHGLGHGVGLQVHEQPVLFHKLKKDTLKPWQVVTNEPGIYIEGEGGVRIEDMMLITEDGVESLTGSVKEMTIL